MAKQKLSKKQLKQLRAKKAMQAAAPPSFKDLAKQSPAAALALSWIAGGVPTESKHEVRTLDNYLLVLERLRNHASEAEGLRVESNKTRREQAATLWSEINRARLIEIRPETYNALYHEADVFTTETIGGKTWKPANSGEAETVAESMEFLAKITQAGKSVPFPEKLPFPAVFLSMKHDLILDNDNITFRAPARFRPSIPPTATGRLLGYLITDGPMVVEFFVVNTEPHKAIFLYEVLYVNQNFPGVEPNQCGWWSQAFMLQPWILNVLVNFVNDHKTLVVEHPDAPFRKKWKSNRKLFNVKRRIPPPYYSLMLRDKIVREELEKTRRPSSCAVTFQYGHRFDVRRHERVKVMRGALPLSDKLRKRLQKEEGRRIYTIEPLRSDDLERLVKRGIPAKRFDEWMSILVTEIQPHQKPNNPQLPYIPATRKLPKKRTISL